jgi:hypothetical protein
MEAARIIREAVARVSQLRATEASEPALRGAVFSIKALQARRFAGTYRDLLTSGPSAAAARFFLEELYSDKDYTERDAQFARIAGAIERFFPDAVAETAVGLAKLHSLTEGLDHAMGRSWLALGDMQSEANRYVAAWRAVDRRPDREAQVQVVLAIGDDMIRLTRTLGLRTMLRMMRKPAAAAGLGSLQRFLESGFDTFAAMARGNAAQRFLDTVGQRESALVEQLFDAELVACGTELARTLGQAP